MEERPAVPPKDDTPTSPLEFMFPGASASGSKRKREPNDETIYELRNGKLEPEEADTDAHTPKRSRSALRQSDEADLSEDGTPAKMRNVRRKKGHRNLSTISLRQAAQEQARESQVRGSKFQEGSLTDKPSEKPPSAFTRFIRTDSDNIEQVDELMADYHNTMSTPRTYSDQDDLAKIPDEVAAEDARQSSFFRFGRSIATNFNPIALWCKIWRETKEEMILQNVDANRRKAALARQKADAEARYAELKRAGQLGAQGSHLTTGTGKVFAEGYTKNEDATPRDSGIVIDSVRASHEHKRAESRTSQFLMLPPDQGDSASRSASPAPDAGASSGLKSIKSRFHIKKPSLSNLRGDLKRVRSDFNLAAHNRQSSSSLSPDKQDNSEILTLRRSASKLDLKKQHKLSKRVSNLETKLQVARIELDQAIVNASPMPKLGNKYERFTPSATLKKPRFIPGKLPSLPSERILFAEKLGFKNNDDQLVEESSEVTRDTMNEQSGASETGQREGVDRTAEEVMEDVLQLPEDHPYPPRLSSLLSIENNGSEDQGMAELDNTQVNLQPPADEATTMDTTDNSTFTSGGQVEQRVAADYKTLDAKLKALDKNVKTSTKIKTKSKKRRSGVDNDDAVFKPGKGTEDDDDWDETPRKKHKSTGKDENSPATKKTKPAPKSSLPKTDKGAAKDATKKTNGTSTGAEMKATAEEAASHPLATEMSLVNDAHGELDELAGDESVRTSIDSQGPPLEPLYEEEEETSLIALKEEPSRPTARATPAHPNRHAQSSSPVEGVRSRSTSPMKTRGHNRAPIVPGTEETLITNAARAAQRGRSVSPLRTRMYSKTTIVKEHEFVTVTPGKNGVPGLPLGDQGRPEALGEDELQDDGGAIRAAQWNGDEFQWPEDVF